MTIWLTTVQVTACELWSECTPLCIRGIDNPADWRALQWDPRLANLDERPVQWNESSKAPMLLLFYLDGARTIATIMNYFGERAYSSVRVGELVAEVQHQLRVLARVPRTGTI